jgi:sulfatase maturation enzyme AslB (radical SAM superfamily)
MARMIEISVFKSDLDLGSMSVQDFSTAIRDALMAASYSNARWFWVEQLYGDRVIVCVEMEGDTYTCKYYEHAYSYDKVAAKFTFGEGYEMKRVSQFVRV